MISSVFVCLNHCISITTLTLFLYSQRSAQVLCMCLFFSLKWKRGDFTLSTILLDRAWLIRNMQAKWVSLGKNKKGFPWDQNLSSSRAILQSLPSLCLMSREDYVGLDWRRKNGERQKNINLMPFETHGVSYTYLSLSEPSLWKTPLKGKTTCRQYKIMIFNENLKKKSQRMPSSTGNGAQRH